MKDDQRKAWGEAFKARALELAETGELFTTNDISEHLKANGLKAPPHWRPNVISTLVRQGMVEDTGRCRWCGPARGLLTAYRGVAK